MKKIGTSYVLNQELFPFNIFIEIYSIYSFRVLSDWNITAICIISVAYLMILLIEYHFWRRHIYGLSVEHMLSTYWLQLDPRVHGSLSTMNMVTLEPKNQTLRLIHQTKNLWINWFLSPYFKATVSYIIVTRQSYLII